MRWMVSALWRQQWDCSVTAVSTDLETRRNPGPIDHRRPGDNDTYNTALNTRLSQLLNGMETISARWTTTSPLDLARLPLLAIPKHL